MLLLKFLHLPTSADFLATMVIGTVIALTPLTVILAKPAESNLYRAAYEEALTHRAMSRPSKVQAIMPPNLSGRGGNRIDEFGWFRRGDGTPTATSFASTSSKPSPAVPGELVEGHCQAIPLMICPQQSPMYQRLIRIVRFHPITGCIRRKSEENTSLGIKQYHNSSNCSLSSFNTSVALMER